MGRENSKAYSEHDKECFREKDMNEQIEESWVGRNIREAKEKRDQGKNSWTQNQPERLNETALKKEGRIVFDEDPLAEYERTGKMTRPRIEYRDAKV
jgi:hypothetical protein